MSNAFDPQVTTTRLLELAMAQHGLKAEHAETIVGPTVTQYAFSPKGTSVRKFEQVAPDLAVALGLDSVRVVAPIPGTSYIGIEVPSITRDPVDYLDLLGEGDEGLTLPIPVGVGVNNQPIWADLVELPHLLIAGQTGSGKSVALNGVIASLIGHLTPDQVRLFLIDPKRVELSAFADAPHVEDVATDADAANELLYAVVAEMDRRYAEFQGAGVRNLAEFNAAHPGVELPRWVVVVDEMADLMMGPAAKVVEPMLVRLAQLARACGIHLVLATQRPVVQVITGQLKANIPSRWAFNVASTVDSMTILDAPGADALYGQGDSLFQQAGKGKPVRVQGAWVSTDIVRAIVKTAQDTYGDVPTTMGAGAASADDDLEMADLRPDDFVGPALEITDSSGHATIVIEGDVHSYEATMAAFAEQIERAEAAANAARQEAQSHTVDPAAVAKAATKAQRATRPSFAKRVTEFTIFTAIACTGGGVTVALVADFINKF